MTDYKCPLGDDCDLTLSYMAGYHDAKKKFADEIERLRSRRNALEEQFQAKLNRMLGMIDEIARLRKENQELKLQYLSDQGQWIEETGRLREALQSTSKMIELMCNYCGLEPEDFIIHVKANNENGETRVVRSISAQDVLNEARAALGEKE